MLVVDRVTKVNQRHRFIMPSSHRRHRQDCLVLYRYTELATSQDSVSNRKFRNGFVQSRNVARTAKTVLISGQFCSHHRHGQDGILLRNFGARPCRLMYNADGGAFEHAFIGQ